MTNPNAVDWRFLENGFIIPSEVYTDQPYLLKTDDGAWLCTLTTGRGNEGQHGQHIRTCRSFDQGQNWIDHCELEPVDGPESAYSVLLKLPTGRIFAFYNYNADNIREVPAEPGPTFNGVCRRVDCLGQFVFRFSDDHGRSWSERRYPIPVREMDIDRANCFEGEVRFFWNVGKPFFHQGSAYVPLIKVGGFGEGCYTRTEGVLLRCSDILDGAPESLTWDTLPDGDFGLRTPPGGGPIAEEQSYSVLSDGSFFAVYRTVDGHPACCYSRDSGRTWSEPEYLRYADGRKIKHPRAANFAWRCRNGKFLYWFHNHGGRDFRDRNPVWLLAGTEADSSEGRIIKWSQPEIALYDSDPMAGMSYPDLLEDDNLFLTETQKRIARVHQIDAGFLEKLWAQFDNRSLTNDLCLLEATGEERLSESLPMPRLPEFSCKIHTPEVVGSKNLCHGFTLEFIYSAPLQGESVLLDNRNGKLAGFTVTACKNGIFRLSLSDGKTECCWESDPLAYLPEALCHVGIIVDGGPRTICFVVDGCFQDGGEHRQFGWGRFDPFLTGVNAHERLRCGDGVKLLRLYGRALLVSELVGNYRYEKSRMQKMLQEKDRALLQS